MPSEKGLHGHTGCSDKELSRRYFFLGGGDSLLRLNTSAAHYHGPEELDGLGLGPPAKFWNMKHVVDEHH